MTKVQGIGGAEQHLLALLPALRERGVDARFLSLDGGLDAERFHQALDDREIPWTRVHCGPHVSPRLAAAVAARVRAERPDLVHTHMVHADAYGSLAARLARTPFVSTRHNDDRYLLGPFRYVDRGLMMGAKRIIAISDAVRTFTSQPACRPPSSRRSTTASTRCRPPRPRRRRRPAGSSPTSRCCSRSAA